MGHEFEVFAWTLKDPSKHDSVDGYEYILKYGGNSFAEAFAIAEQLKKNGTTLVKILWR